MNDQWCFIGTGATMTPHWSSHEAGVKHLSNTMIL